MTETTFGSGFLILSLTTSYSHVNNSAIWSNGNVLEPTHD